MFSIIFIINAYTAIELNSHMGFAKSTHKQKLIVTNGHFPVPFELVFENQLINIDDVTKIGNSMVKCPETKAEDLIIAVNEKLTEAFITAFEPLLLDLQVKDRKERGILVSAATAIGVAAGQHLVAKAIDYLFDSRRKKSETLVSDLEAKLRIIRNDLDLSAIEMCALGTHVLEERINRIATELMLNAETQIKNEIQALYFGHLDNKYGMAACLALNMNARKIDCLKLLRYKKFEFEISKIEVSDDTARIHISILVPIIARELVGFYYYNVGVPQILDNEKVIVKGTIPDFVTPTQSFTFKTNPLHNVIAEQDILSNPNIDLDCYMNATGSDNICDAHIMQTQSDYLLETVDGYTILINFIPCSFTRAEDLDLPTFIEEGLHIVKLERGFLTCGNHRLTFDHVSIHFRKHVSYLNYTTNFNYVDEKVFANLYNKNVFDSDHVFSQVSVVPFISFRVLLIIISIVFFLSLCLIVLKFKSQIRNIYTNIQRPALVY